MAAKIKSLKLSGHIRKNNFAQVFWLNILKRGERACSLLNTLGFITLWENSHMRSTFITATAIALVLGISATAFAGDLSVGSNEGVQAGGAAPQPKAGVNHGATQGSAKGSVQV